MAEVWLLIPGVRPLVYKGEISDRPANAAVFFHFVKISGRPFQAK